MESVSIVESQDDRCVFCRQVCRPRQHCLQCDFCYSWQHRTCQTGISQPFYRQMVKGAVTLDNWQCYVCELTDGLSNKVFTPLDELTDETTRADNSSKVPEKNHENILTPVRSSRPTNIIPNHQQHLKDPTEAPAPCSAAPTTVCHESAEDEISVLYPVTSPLPLSNKKTPRSSGMPQLLSRSSSSEELRLYLPASPDDTSSAQPPRGPASPTPESQTAWLSCDSPLPSFSSFLPRSPASPPQVSKQEWHAATEDSTLSPVHISSHLTPLRDLAIPATVSPPAWSATTDSPFPSPTSFLMSPANLTSYQMSSPLPLFRDVESDDSSPDLSSPLAQLQDRLAYELKL